MECPRSLSFKLSSVDPWLVVITFTVGGKGRFGGDGPC